MTVPTREAADESVDRWSGRFSATWTAATDPAQVERASGRFELASGPARTALEILTPFGQSVVRARSDPAGASLQTADGRRYSADTPEALTEIVLGWRIPMSRLPGWLAASGPDQVVEDDWDVRVEAREGSLPQRLRLQWPASGPSADGRGVTIRLVMDPPASSSATSR